ncbi:MAG: RNA repair transcriptional activator RtcR [Polyangiaceae bacterium]|jgi:transcriptional regulatory protein RtcR|nr:RNA repair transcriptional activator RtcR [Polyangiaceae bacterium]
MARALDTVVLGFLGTTLDGGATPARWERWRPSVALCQHPDLLVRRFDLLYPSKVRQLADTVIADIARVSPETEVVRHEIEFVDAWDFEEVYGALHDFAKGYPYRPEREDYLVHITTGTHVGQICLFLLAESRRLPGRLLQTSPPRRGEGPGSVGSYAVIDLDLSKYDRLAARFDGERLEGASFLKAGIETKNAAFNRLIDRIEQVAVASRAPLLLTGPTGAGKTQLAQRIYELKRARRQLGGEFVPVNCATLRGDAAMSTLFGHVKGAFTGALKDRPGLLQRANGGLLFLDEVGELGLDEQAMLLRAIEEKTFYPMGSDRLAQSDFQLIAGTNRDLSGRISAGRFRDDLLARINLWSFALPALRERPEDIEPNLRYELEQAGRALGANVTMSREAKDRYLAFARSPAALWSGNFRDLNASVTRMATLARGGRISVEVVDEELGRLAALWAGAPGVAGPGAGDEALLDGVLAPDALAGLDRFDRVQLAEVVRVCRRARSLSDAGRALFASSRLRKSSSNDADRLRKYLTRFGLDGATLLPAASPEGEAG